jgi:hypothetical protein
MSKYSIRYIKSDGTVQLIDNWNAGPYYISAGHLAVSSGTSAISAGPGGPIIFDGSHFYGWNGSSLVQLDSTASGGGGTPGGPTYSVQFNDGGILSGTSAFKWFPLIDEVHVAGNISAYNISATSISANEITIGSSGMKNYIDNTVNELLSAGPNIQLTYNEGARQLEISASPAEPGGSDKNIQLNVGGSLSGSDQLIYDYSGNHLILTSAGSVGPGELAGLLDFKVGSDNLGRIAVYTGTGNTHGQIRLYGYSAGWNEGLRISQDGYIGIGGLEPNPSYVMEVLGESRFRGSLTITGGNMNVYTDSSAIIALADSGNVQGYLAARTGATEGVHIGALTDDSTFFIGNSTAVSMMRSNGYWGLGYAATESVVERLSVNGAIKLGAAAGTNEGTIEWDGSNFRGYTGSTWKNLDVSGAGGTPGGSDTYVQFNDGGSFGGMSGLVWDKTTLRLGIGISSPTKELDVASDTPGKCTIASTSYYDSARDSGQLQIRKARGTLPSPAAISAGDRLGIVGFHGYHGSGFAGGGYFIWEALEDFAGTAGGTKAIFATVPVGSTSQAVALTIQNQSLFVGGNVAPRQRLDILNGAGSGALLLGLSDDRTLTAGTIEWDGTNFRGYNGTDWKYLDIPPTGTAAGGNDQQAQFNNSGVLSGSDDFLMSPSDVSNSTFFRLLNRSGDYQIIMDAAVWSSGHRAHRSYLRMLRGRGTYDSTNAVEDADIIGSLSYMASDGTDNGFAGMKYGCRLTGLAVGDWSATNRGTNLILEIVNQDETGLNPLLQIGTLGGGEKIIQIYNADAVPTSNAGEGGFLYADSGALKWRGQGGTTTTLGTSDPHCKQCGSDYVLEYEREEEGEYFMVCMKCMVDFIEKLNNNVKPDWVVKDKREQYPEKFQEERI